VNTIWAKSRCGLSETSYVGIYVLTCCSLNTSTEVLTDYTLLLLVVMRIEILSLMLPPLFRVPIDFSVLPL
jgi:hypothetical protein